MKTRLFRKKETMIGCVLIIVLLSIGVIILLNYDETPVFYRYVINHKNELGEYVNSLKTENETDHTEMFNGFEVRYFAGSGMAEFELKDPLPSNTHRGFYYSPNDKPLGYFDSMLYFEQDGDGWKCDQIVNTHITEYTERITDHWFWFEFNF